MDGSGSITALEGANLWLIQVYPDDSGEPLDFTVEGLPNVATVALVSVNSEGVDVLASQHRRDGHLSFQLHKTGVAPVSAGPHDGLFVAIAPCNVDAVALQQGIAQRRAAAVEKTRELQAAYQAELDAAAASGADTGEGESVPAAGPAMPTLARLAGPARLTRGWPMEGVAFKVTKGGTLARPGSLPMSSMWPDVRLAAGVESHDLDKLVLVATRVYNSLPNDPDVLVTLERGNGSVQNYPDWASGILNPRCRIQAHALEAYTGDISISYTVDSTPYEDSCSVLNLEPPNSDTVTFDGLSREASVQWVSGFLVVGEIQST